MNILAEYRYDGIYHLEFEFKGKRAIALMLEDESRRNGKTVFKTEYFGAFPDLQNEFVKRGYTLIFLENRNRWGTDSEIDDQIAFISYASKEFGISDKVITLGMSCFPLIVTNSKSVAIVPWRFINAFAKRSSHLNLSSSLALSDASAVSSIGIYNSSHRHGEIGLRKHSSAMLINRDNIGSDTEARFIGSQLNMVSLS